MCPVGWDCTETMGPPTSKTPAASSAVVIGSPSENHDRRVGAATDGVAKRGPRALDLARPALAAQLPRELDQLAERRRSQRLAFRQEAATRIDGQPPAHARRPFLDELGSVARRAQPQFLIGKQLPGRVGVLALDDID